MKRKPAKRWKKKKQIIKHNERDDFDEIKKKADDKKKDKDKLKN